jgi:hypothetical protein
MRDFDPYALGGGQVTYVGGREVAMNTASKHGPHTQKDRGTCPGVDL